MKFEDLKKNDYVKWTADRKMGGVTYKQWDTFGKVISYGDGKLVVLTYDDLRKTELSADGDAIRDEITPASRTDVPVFRRLIGIITETF